MEKLLAEKYKSNRYIYSEDQMELLSNILSSSVDAVTLLFEIAKETRKENVTEIGLTKIMMKERFNLSKHACNNAIYLLLGPGLICYEEHQRMKYYQTTIRGDMLLAYMGKHGYLEILTKRRDK